MCAQFILFLTIVPLQGCHCVYFEDNFFGHILFIAEAALPFFYFYFYFLFYFFYFYPHFWGDERRSGYVWYVRAI